MYLVAPVDYILASLYISWSFESKYSTSPHIWLLATSHGPILYFFSNSRILKQPTYPSLANIQSYYFARNKDAATPKLRASSFALTHRPLSFSTGPRAPIASCTSESAPAAFSSNDP